MSKRNIVAIALAALLLTITSTSCLESDVEDYAEWREQNDTYLAQLDKSEYETICPEWAPLNPVYVKWHNDRSLTANNFQPMANSTVDCIYVLSDIEGTIIDQSYNSLTGDSIYQCMPQSNVIGFESALLSMHEGDSVTVVIPYVSGYGMTGNGSVRPYTNLIFGVKLKEIQDFLKPNL